MQRLPPPSRRRTSALASDPQPPAGARPGKERGGARRALRALGRGARVFGRDMAGPLRRAGMELSRSSAEVRGFWGLLRALYETLRPGRPASDAAFDAAAEEKGSPLRTGCRCLLWIAAGWQLSQVSGDATAFANTARGVWVAVALLWGFGMLFPRRPGLLEMLVMAAAAVWACWPS